MQAVPFAIAVTSTFHAFDRRGARERSERGGDEASGGEESRMVDAVPPGRHPATTSSHGVAAASAAPVAVASVAPNKELLTKGGIAWRIAFVVDRIASWLKCGSRNDPCNLMQPCYVLARFSSNTVGVIASFVIPFI